jgi:acid phosphatase (class A)
MTASKLTRDVILFGCLAASLPGQVPARAPKTPVFISPAVVDAVVLITPPPALNSKKMSKDLAEIFAIHRSATPQEIERANWDNEHENIFAIAKVLDSNLTAESMPATAKLWADMSNDQSIFVSAAKKFFQEPRPYDVDPSIKSICGSKAGGPKNSYPSGHGTVGYLSALVLSMMVPEKGEAIRARADEYAHNRVVCGDHYASDLTASKEAAGLLMGNMIGTPKFQQEFAAAKGEIRRALGLSSQGNSIN